MTDIQGRAAVVTGGASGIGKGLALALAQAGASVAVADLQFDRAERVAAEVRARDVRGVALACDVCERASVLRMRDATQGELGPVTLVFANAGATSVQPLVKMTDDDVDWII